MSNVGGGAFAVDLDTLQQLAETMKRYGSQTEERTVALHSTVEGIPMEGRVKQAAIGWADRWCSQTEDQLAALHAIQEWATLAHSNYTQARNANVALWET